jgi:hypothetical protein
MSFNAHDVERTRAALGWQVLQLPLIEQRLAQLPEAQAMYVKSLLDRLSVPGPAAIRRNLIVELGRVLGVIPNQVPNTSPIIRS